MNQQFESKLIDLYHRVSKHSNYQELPRQLQGLLPVGNLETNSRFEQARMTYLRRHIDFREKSIADIGGNTGFFTFEAIDSGAASVLLIEGNTAHSQFVAEAVRMLKLESRVSVSNQYFSFERRQSNEIVHFDVVFLMNVLHHIGDDFGNRSFSKENALAFISEKLREMDWLTNTLVFQLGFNWKGDRNLPLFEHGTKREIIDFVANSVDGVWNVVQIGIANKVAGIIGYDCASSANIHRDDSLGEFLNRPIFILSRKT